jgi:tetratricopeptide (TPR) repeat protein
VEVIAMKKLVAAAPALALLGGCFWATTKSEGQALRKDVTSLETRIGTKEQALDDQINQLKKVLDDATKLLKRNSADLGLEVEQLRADDALYFRGQAYTNLKDWEKAIGIYQQLLDKYPDGSFTDDGLYFAALAAQQLKQCTESRTYLGIIKSKYPKSNVAKQASELDAAIKKDLKSKSKCVDR